MYIPKSNEVTDKNEAIEFMKRFSFATIITAKNNLPVATHLPFLVESRNGTIVLLSHFARANDQWKDLEESVILVIFSEPHAYISPSNYTKKLNVPTWNYISVHVYGEGKLISESSRAAKLLERTIDYYEDAYKLQWDSLPEEYKSKMLKGIVAFEIEVTSLQAKKKLSQNKTEEEQQKIIHLLSDSENTNEKLIADYMMEEKGKGNLERG